MQKLFNEGQIRSEGDIHMHEHQDAMYELGYPIDINILDSLFDGKLDRGYANSISIVNSADSLVDYIGDIDYNYKTELHKLGFEGYQNVYVEAYIPLSSFVKKSILVAISSFITLLVVLSALLYLIIVLKKREEELNRRELSISGVIHDLKSPLINVSAMLDFLETINTCDETHGFVIQSQKSVENLIFRIESLLRISRSYGINKTTTHPEYIKKDKIGEYIDILSQELK